MYERRRLLFLFSDMFFLAYNEIFVFTKTSVGLMDDTRFAYVHWRRPTCSRTEHIFYHYLQRKRFYSVISRERHWKPLKADYRDWRTESAGEDNTKTMMKRDEQSWKFFRATTLKLSFCIRAETIRTRIRTTLLV